VLHGHRDSPLVEPKKSESPNHVPELLTGGCCFAAIRRSLVILHAPRIDVISF
jgi:hypothetical protein